MKSDEIRERFLSFFESQGHRRVPSSSLIPANDPTLMFANAGMNQFKDIFLGRETPDYKTAVSSQKCVRAGGKHNDLDNVGYTARHHTFFEMLGNFSFGDYFKLRAIQLAWRFLTEQLAIPPDRLYVTVYDDDDEAYDLWHHQVGVPAERLFRFGEKDNFWAMGDTGPCGPCSEIFYDYGSAVPGPDDPHEAIASGSDRIVEIWNLVFMQYDRAVDGTMTPLPNPSIDTGMGLERIASVLQGCTNNYDTDLFLDIINPSAALLGVTPGSDPKTDTALRVIADHLRAVSFLIADGVRPSNEGRGYVLRRIMRRAMRYGKQLGREEAFLHLLTGHVVDKMGAHYPNLVNEREQIALLVKVEEQQFARTLHRGMPILNKYLERLAAQQLKRVPGAIIHTMYDTYGFPVDLMGDIARDAGLSLDMADYQKVLDAGQSEAGGSHFAAEQVNPVLVEAGRTFATEQTCHAGLSGGGRVKRILVDEAAVARVEAPSAAKIILDSTSFYAESGGQIGDRGVIRTATGEFRVDQTSKYMDLVIHEGVVASGYLTEGQTGTTQVAAEPRSDTMKNHTATHLLHEALRRVLGLHVRQAGSLVDPDKLRFDFNHFAPLDAAEIAEIEDQVNGRILANLPVTTEVLPQRQALESGAIAFFGEKYGETVRVVGVGDYSKEFCGGTHVAASGEIGCFKILSERGLAAGVRRLVALTGKGALARFRESERLLDEARDRFFLNRETFVEQLQREKDERKALEQRIDELKLRLAKGAAATERIEEFPAFKVILKQVSEVGGGQLRQLADELLGRIAQGVVLLGSAMDGKVQLIVKTNRAEIHAGQLVGQMAEVVGGKGGGRPDMAMAGGKDAASLGKALEAGLAHVRKSLDGSR